MITPRLQYIVYQGLADYSDQYVVKVFEEGSIRGRVVAAHRKIESVRLAIPTSHVKANHRQESPIVEVWIDKSVA